MSDGDSSMSEIGQLIMSGNGESVKLASRVDDDRAVCLPLLEASAVAMPPALLPGALPHRSIG